MLRQGNCVKLLEASGGGDLEAPAGQSLLIKGIYCKESTNDTYLTLQTDRVTVGFYRVEGYAGNQLVGIVGAEHKLNLMEFLTSKGINVSLPVAEGQVFTVSRYAEAGYVVLVFDRYDAGDIRSDMPNGSAAKEYTFMQYMDISAKVAGDGDGEFDLSLSPAEFPDFPCGKSVPANHRITMLGLVGTPACLGLSGTKGWYTKAVKLVREREVLFDEDRVGIPFLAYYTSGTSAMYEAAFSLIGSGMYNIGWGMTGTGEPLIFDPALVFEAGVELGVFASLIEFGTTPTWATDVIDLAAILKVEKV